MRRFAISFLMVLSALAVSGMPAMAAKKDDGVAVNTFIATATTGIGQPLPAELTIDPTCDAGLGYRYEAEGTAQGDIPGTFTYVETGCVLFEDPTDPSSAVIGNEYRSGVITLEPKHEEKHGGTIVIEDVDPAGYEFGVESGKPPAFARKVVNPSNAPKNGLKTKGSNATSAYVFFTFTSSEQRSTGYATTDFRNFIIEVAFSTEDE